MEAPKLTTIQLETVSLDKLKKLAEANRRSAKQHLAWLIDWEYEKWQKTEALDAAQAKAARRNARAA